MFWVLEDFWRKIAKVKSGKILGIRAPTSQRVMPCHSEAEVPKRAPPRVRHHVAVLRRGVDTVH